MSVLNDFDQTKLLVPNESDISRDQMKEKFKMERVSKKVKGIYYNIVLPKDDLIKPMNSQEIEVFSLSL